mgnify:CR=1 FL=1
MPDTPAQPGIHEHFLSPPRISPARFPTLPKSDKPYKQKSNRLFLFVVNMQQTHERAHYAHANAYIHRHKTWKAPPHQESSIVYQICVDSSQGIRVSDKIIFSYALVLFFQGDVHKGRGQTMWEPFCAPVVINCFIR